MASNSLCFMKFRVDNKYSIDEIIDKLTINDIEDKFIVNEATDSIIDGYYVTYVNSKEFVFDEDSSSLKSIIMKKNLIIPFSIDISREILDIWSKKSNIGRFITQLSIVFNHEIEINPMVINLEEVANKLDRANIKVRNIKIDNYQLEENIIANCTFDLKNHSNPVEIINKYSKNLVHITLTVLLDTKELFTMMIYKSGSIVIYQYKEEISQEHLDFIREICIV